MTRPDGGLAGRVAVVTGAASGIGAATATRLVTEGAGCVLVDIDPSVSAVAGAIGGPDRAVGIVADVADEDRWGEIVETATTRLGPVDILVCNAFTVDDAPAHRTSTESWERQVRVNLTAAFWGFKACLPGLQASGSRGGGSVVLVSSVHARAGLPRRPAYAATKGALVSLAQQLAVEYGPEVRVNSVLPGPVLTGAWDDISSDDRRLTADATVVRRLGHPDEVAATIAFLASSEASYVTGASLVVDGGWSVKKESS